MSGERKIVQIAAAGNHANARALFVLADDGTAWVSDDAPRLRSNDWQPDPPFGNWTQIPALPSREEQS